MRSLREKLKTKVKEATVKSIVDIVQKILSIIDLILRIIRKR